MKAKPLKFDGKTKYEPCTVTEATHIELNIPGPFSYRILPIIIKGSRSKSNRSPIWTWNGDTENVTIKPSVKTTDGNIICHIWINDGNVIFLEDSTHSLAGKTLPLNNIDKIS